MPRLVANGVARRIQQLLDEGVGVARARGALHRLVFQVVVADLDGLRFFHDCQRAIRLASQALQYAIASGLDAIRRQRTKTCERLIENLFETLWTMGHFFFPDRSRISFLSLDRDRNGRGLATRGLAALVEVAFGEVGLHRLEAGALVENVASQRVLEKNRFTRIGVAPRYLRIAGAWREHQHYHPTHDD